MLPKAQAIRDELVARGIRVMLDDRDSQTPGWKFNEWELRGVPLRLEIGPKDIEKSTGRAGAARHAREVVRADGRARPRTSSSCWRRSSRRCFDRAIAFRTEHTTETDSYDEFKQIMDGPARLRRLALVRLGGVRGGDQDRDAGDDPQHPVRERAADGKTCLKCGRPATAHAWFAKSY